MKHEYDIKKELKRLRSIRGSGTELISVYIPPGYPISDMTNKLKDEYGQASNIKSKTTKLNVQGAIDKIIQYLKVFKAPPKNGVAVFCGNISSVQAKPDIELFSIEPPQPLKSNIYRCDSTFMLEPIEGMLEAKEMYILVVMDGRDATVGVLKGTYFQLEKRVRSFAHAKVRKGGQSAGRYERAIEESIDDFYKSIASAVNDIFHKYQGKVNGMLVGGPGPMKETFVRSRSVNYQIKMLGTFDTGYVDEHKGVEELIEKARDLLQEQDVMKERNVMEKFLNEVARNGLAVSGLKKVKEALQSDNAARVIISEDIDIAEVTYKCNAEGVEFTKIETGNSRQEKHECGGNLEIVGQKDPVDDIIELADRKNVDIVFVSTNSQYGNELLLGFQGIVAMLKYKK